MNSSTEAPKKTTKRPTTTTHSSGSRREQKVKSLVKLFSKMGPSSDSAEEEEDRPFRRSTLRSSARFDRRLDHSIQERRDSRYSLRHRRSHKGPSGGLRADTISRPPTVLNNIGPYSKYISLINGHAEDSSLPNTVQEPKISKECQMRFEKRCAALLSTKKVLGLEGTLSVLSKECPQKSEDSTDSKMSNVRPIEPKNQNAPLPLTRRPPSQNCSFQPRRSDINVNSPQAEKMSNRQNNGQLFRKGFGSFRRKIPNSEINSQRASSSSSSPSSVAAYETTSAKSKASSSNYVPEDETPAGNVKKTTKNPLKSILKKSSAFFKTRKSWSEREATAVSGSSEDSSSTLETESVHSERHSDYFSECDADSVRYAPSLSLNAAFTSHGKDASSLNAIEERRRLFWVSEQQHSNYDKYQISQSFIEPEGAIPKYPERKNKCSSDASHLTDDQGTTSNSPPCSYCPGCVVPHTDPKNRNAFNSRIKNLVRNFAEFQETEKQLREGIIWESPSAGVQDLLDQTVPSVKDLKQKLDDSFKVCEEENEEYLTECEDHLKKLREQLCLIKFKINWLEENLIT